MINHTSTSETSLPMSHLYNIIDAGRINPPGEGSDATSENSETCKPVLP